MDDQENTVTITEKVSSGTTEGIVYTETAEVRKFDLNEARALLKKMRNTDKEDITFVPTSGGLKLLFNTGMYELFKHCADTHYSSDKLEIGCQKIPVYDKKGNLVETKYKLNSSGKSVYTLNLYHTKCACLVNGKEEDLFINSHLEKILNLVECKLQEQHWSIGDLNCRVKQAIQTCVLSRKHEEGTSANKTRSKTKNGSVKVNNTNDNNQNKYEPITGQCSRFVDHTNTSVSREETKNVHDTRDTRDEIRECKNKEDNNDCEIKTGNSKTTIERVNNATGSMNENDERIDVAEQKNDNSCTTEGENTHAIADIVKTLHQLGKEVKDLRNDLKLHVSSTNRKLQKISDDLSSICTKTETISDDKICKLTTMTKEKDYFKEQLGVMSENLQKKLDRMTEILTINVPGKKDSDLKSSDNVLQNQIQKSTKEHKASETPKSRTKHSPVINTTRFSHEETILKEPQSSNKGPNTTIRKKVLIIGDSILKGIHIRGLKRHVRVMTCRGKQILDISSRLYTMNLDYYDSIIVYAGGNDAANRTPLESIYEELKRLIGRLSKKCKISLCTICPRKDAEVTPLNDIIKQVCEQSTASLIDCYTSFVDGAGKMVDALYHRDSIHLLPAGTRTLLKVLDKSIPIIKTNLAKMNSSTVDAKRESQYGQRKRENTNNQRLQRENNAKGGRRCWNCGRSNHNSNECWNLIW